MHGRERRYSSLIASSGSSRDARWAGILSSYNGGLGWLQRDQRLTAELGANPARWFGHVELYSTRSAAAFAENRDYVRRILLRWRPLYEGF